MKKIILILFIAFGVTNLMAQSDVKTTFNNSLTSYFEAKNALSKDDAGKASTASQKLATTIKALNIASAKDANKAEIAKQSAIILKNATAIASSKDIKSQRKSFAPVSSAMLALIRSLKLNQATVYVQYCPMVKQHWLNEVEAVQNPFYGSMMYDCGEVSETIASK